jgi:hypothetical protein
MRAIGARAKVSPHRRFPTFQGQLASAKSSLLKLHGTGFDAQKKIEAIQETLLRKKLKEKMAEVQGQILLNFLRP